MGKSKPKSKPAVALLPSVSAMGSMISALKNAPFGVSKMGCFTGPSGRGKSSAAAYGVSQYECFYIEIREEWTHKFFAQELAKNVGTSPKGSIPEILARVADSMAEAGCPLILDDCQAAVRFDALTLAKNLYERSGVPVIIVGEEKLPDEIAKIERVRSRISRWYQVPACQIDDTKKLARHYREDLTFADDFLRKCTEMAEGSARVAVHNLQMAAQLADEGATTEIDLAFAEDHDRFHWINDRAPRPRTAAQLRREVQL